MKQTNNSKNQKKKPDTKLDTKTDGSASKKDDSLKMIKSKLQNFEELNREYELVEDNLTLKIVLRKMSETLENYIKILIQILQPEEFHSLQECAVFDEAEKVKIFDLYKDLMITHRELLKAEIENTEKNNIATINYVHEEIKKAKPELLKIVAKMQDSWKNIAKKSNIKYFG